MPNEIIFKVEDCSKHFRPTVALNHVDFSIKRGKITGLIGENGSGKSIIMISEELAELIGMSDNIAIIKDGTLTKTFTRSPKLSESEIIKYMI